MKNNLLLMSLGFVATSAAQTVSPKPNVIFLVADDLGYGDISCYGAKGVQTPCLDSIAQGGIRFVDAHVCASTSTPSRYAMFTGEYPFRKSGTGIAKGDESMIIAPEQFTIADVFKSAGYKTGAVGKWHLGLGSKAGKQDWNATLDQHLGDLGFDYHYIMAATADRVPCAFIENGRIANHDAENPIYVSYRQNFPGEPTGKDNPELLTKLKSSHGHNQAIVNGIGRIGYMKGGGKALWKDENIADSIVAHAIQFMENSADHPFFLYLGTNDVHVPRYPHERFRGKSPMGLRGEAILQFDWTVKQVAEALKRLGIAENTLLIITSDNGPVLDDGYQDHAKELVGEHKPSGPFRGGKYGVYEGGSVVPFIVNWPAEVQGGKESRAMVSLIDNVASMAQLVGVDLPEGAARDSRPQLETWLGKSPKSCPFAIAIGNGRTIDVREGHWKYVEPGKGGMAYPSGPHAHDVAVASQLFDLSDDFRESTNVAGDNMEKVIHFENLLDSVLKGDYPVCFDEERVSVNPECCLQKIIVKTNSSTKQMIDLKSCNTMYVDAMNQTIIAKPGDILVPEFSYTGKNMNGYVYLDREGDGVFDAAINDDLSIPAGSDLISFSYFGKNNATSGKNSDGLDLSGNKRFVLNPPAFTIPSDLSEGYYRMRFKVDHNDINPNGSSSIVEENGRIVDVRLLIQNDVVPVTAYSQHGRLCLADGKDLNGKEIEIPFGQTLTLRMIPDKGYEISGLRVKHGFHFEEDSLSHGNIQWENVLFDRSLFSGDEFAIPVACMNGQVEVEGLFVEEGTYVKPEKPTRYMTTTVTNHEFAPATSWYSIQISAEKKVLSDNEGADYIRLLTSEVDSDNPKHLWCFVGDEEKGYKIYNMNAGADMVLAAPVQMKGVNGSLSYPKLVPADKVPSGYVDIWRFLDSADLGEGKEFTYLYEDGLKSNKVNRRGEKLAFWCKGQDAGSTLIVNFVKKADAPTGIEHLLQESQTGSCYDLKGRKIETPDKGIYVKDGHVLYRK